MKRTSIFAFLILFTGKFSFADGLPSCKCPEIKCSPCESELKIEFYSEKCQQKVTGKDDVRSCKRPLCVLQTKMTSVCLDFKKAQGLVSESSSVPSETNKPAEVVKAAAVMPVGIVVVARGEASVTSQTEKTPLKIGVKVYEKDVIVTGASGAVKIMFYDKNVMHVTANSKVEIAELKYSTVENEKKTLINLSYGKIRNQVNQKYEGENYFRIKTKIAIAGVRGTDFVTDYSEKNSAEMKIQTFHGEVELAPPSTEKKLKIGHGQYASFVVQDVPKNGVFTDEDVQRFVKRGYLTPVYAMEKEEIKKLDWETNLEQEQARAPTSAETSDNEFICHHPKGRLNDCAWVMKANPQGEPSCERSRCNGNGQWSEPFRLPLSSKGMCKGSTEVVKPCDY